MLERLFPQQADDRLFVEDVFSTWPYTGGSAQNILNNIDLAGKGGLVWIKIRNATDGHALFDTDRGVNNKLISNDTIASSLVSNSLTTFYSFGFRVGGVSAVNSFGGFYSSWTFRKAPKFFDIVTWTGNNANRNIDHNLGVAPGMILAKRTSGMNASWQIYHQSLGANQVMDFSTGAASSFAPWNSTTPTATNFRISSSSTINAPGETHVAYLFAHDPSADGLIQCGSYTGNGSATGPVITLGWEPQWIMVKYAGPPGYSGNNWQIIDNMRGLPVGSADATLQANLSDAETSVDYISPTATGFQVVSTSSQVNTSTFNYIYMAIRRGPMRTPTLGTSVFSPNLQPGTTGSAVTTGFPIDMAIVRWLGGVDGNKVQTRLIGFDTRIDSSAATPLLFTNAANSESSSNTGNYGYNNQGSLVGVSVSSNGWSANFRRAPGFMDVVCYTGNDVDGRTVNHNLGVAPELLIVKRRAGGTTGWYVYSQPTGSGSMLILNQTDAAIGFSLFANTAPTNSVFSVSSSGATNQSGSTYVAYLFASVPGVSKVGSYTGNGSSQTINCAFTTGARFVMIKRTDSTGDWYVWDSARGIVAGNDPYLALNTQVAPVTSNDSVDADSTGFVVNQVAASNINVSAATYIFLAIA